MRSRLHTLPSVVLALIVVALPIAATLMAGCQTQPTATPVPLITPAEMPTSPPSTVPTQALAVITETAVPLTPTAIQDTPTASAETPASQAEQDEVVLEVVGLDGTTRSLTMEDLGELPQQEGWAGLKSSTGRIYPPRDIDGVALTELISLVGELDADMAVRVVAEDGYAMTISYGQIVEGDFITYDPGTGDEVEIDEDLAVTVAYAADGEPLDPREEGPLRLVVVSPEQNQVVDGHWSVKWVSRIELQPLSADWILYLKGAITEEMDRGTFESGAAPNCHGATWTDEEGNVWTGIPLWLLTGRVDDDNPHEGRAFNRQLADAGYRVEVVALDGYKVSLPIEEIRQDQDYVVAYLMNDEPLSDEYFSLRLVGSGLDKSQMVGQIAEIRLYLDAEQMPSPSPAPTREPTVVVSAPSDAVLVVEGAVKNSLALTRDDLQAADLTEVTVEHPKQGEEDYRGILLNMLLDMAKPAEGAVKATLIAEDGYSAQVFLKEIRACKECMLALDGEEGLRAIMPGLQSNFWVKDVVRIEIE